MYVMVGIICVATSRNAKQARIIKWKYLAQRGIRSHGPQIGRRTSYLDKKKNGPERDSITRSSDLKADVLSRQKILSRGGGIRSHGPQIGRRTSYTDKKWNLVQRGIRSHGPQIGRRTSHTDKKILSRGGYDLTALRLEGRRLIPMTTASDGKRRFNSNSYIIYCDIDKSRLCSVHFKENADSRA